MEDTARIRDIPSGDGISKIYIREEKMNAVQLTDHLQCAGSDGGLKDAPSLLVEPFGDIFSHQPIVLNHQDRQAIEGIGHCSTSTRSIWRTPLEAYCSPWGPETL